MRSLKISLAQKAFILFAQKSTAENENAPNLVFRLDDKIGDSITATGFLYELKNKFPRQKLIVLAGKNAAFIYIIAVFP